MLEHNVDTFIALSSPLAGQYGGEFQYIYVLEHELIKFVVTHIHVFFFSFSYFSIQRDIFAFTFKRKNKEYMPKRHNKIFSDGKIIKII